MSEKRQKLEEAARDAVQRSGLHSLSFRTLADQIGIKSSSVHYYFPEKSDLAAALIETYTEAFSEQLEQIDQRALTPAGRLDAFVQIFEDVVSEDKFCLCGMMAAEVASLTTHNSDLLARYFTVAEDWLTKTVDDAREQGGEHGLTSRAAASVIMASLEGAILIDRVNGGKRRLKALRELIKQVL